MKTRKILSAIALALAVTTTNVGAYDAYLYGEYVNITSVEFSDVSGSTIDVLPSEGEVTISLNAKKGKSADDYQGVTVVAALYNGENLQGVETESFSLDDNYTKNVEFNVDVTGATGLRVYVCDNLSNGRPFASKAIFAANNNALKSITIGGEELEGFSPEIKTYDITVPARHIIFPEVTPQLMDAGAKCELSFTGSFPLDKGKSAKVEIRVGDTNPTTYTLNLTQEQPEITNLKVVDEIKSDGTEVIDPAPGLVQGVNPEKYAEEPAEPIKYSTNSSSGDDMTIGYGYSNVSGTAFFSDRSAYAAMFVPTELYNAYMIQPKMYFENKTGSYATFDINRPATVYAAVKVPAELAAEGYTKVPGMKISYNNCNPEAGRLYSYDAYAKHYEVSSDGVTTVTIPHGFLNAYVVFDESSPVANPIMTNKNNGEQHSLPTVDVRNSEYLPWNHPDYSEGIESYSYAAKFVAEKQDDKYMFSTDFPEELLGSTGIAVRSNPRNYGRNETDIVTFELKQSADVYISYESEYSEMEWMETLGYEDVSDQFGPITYVHDANLTEYSTKMYKKSYTVVPGETVKVNIGSFGKINKNPETGSNYKIPPMIFVKVR